MANGGFEIPVDILPQVKDSGNTQKFFTDLANQGATAINKVAKAAGQPIKQEVIFQVQDGEMVATIRKTSELLKKMERAKEAATKKEQAALKQTAREEAAFRKRQIQDIERARRADAKRLAELEKRAQAARAAELKKIREAVAEGQKQLEKERQVNAEIGKRKALINGAMVAQKGSLNALQADLDLQKLRLNNTKMGTQAYKNQTAVVQKLQAEMDKLTQSGQKGSASIVSGFIKAQIAMAAMVAVMNQFRQVFSDTFERGSAEQRFRNLTDSAAEYEQAIRLAKIASADFGITQTEATQGLSDLYARLKGVGYGLTEVNTIFRGFRTLAIQAGVSSEDAAGAFFQLSQALGSGKLQGDELRSILERMPQVTQLIASEMNVAAGRIKEMGAAGEITADVIYAAMQSAANGTADLTSYLTDAQIAMNESKQRAENMRVALGEALQPAYITILNGLADAGLVLAGAFEKANEFVKKNAEQIKTLVKVGLEVAKIAASVFVVVKAYQAYQKAVAMVVSIKAALAALSGVGLAKVAAAVGLGTAAYITMGNAIDGVGDEITKLKTEAEQDLEKTREEADALSDSFKGIGGGAKEAEVDAKEAFSAMQAELKAVGEQYKIKNDAINAGLALTRERINSEQTILDLQLQSAKAELDGAENAEEREAAARKIMELKIKEAELQKKADLAQIQAAEQKAALAVEELKIKQQIVKTEMELAEARGDEVQNYQKALESLKNGLTLAKQQHKNQQAISKEQRKQVENVYELNKEAAKLAYNTNKVYKNTKSAASAAGSYAKEMERAADAAKETEKSVQSTSRVVAQFDMYGNKIEPTEIIDWGSMTESQALDKAQELQSARIDSQMKKIREQEEARREGEHQAAMAEMEAAFDSFIQQQGEYSKGVVNGVKQAKDYTDQQLAQMRVQFENAFRISNRDTYAKATFNPSGQDGYRYMNFPTAGARADGGPVSGGSTYTVNERGREGFLSASGRLSEINVPSWGSWRAPSSGEVIPAHVWSEMKAANSAVASSASRLASGGASGMVSRIRQSGDVDNSRVTNHVTIQSASPIQAASEIMVAAAKRRHRRFR